ncbi:MAG TPA: hypothetical protein VMW01_05115 [Williamwhitmania sp.]|nr:hypothetical protein [Williamwhitmania sp.]
MNRLITILIFIAISPVAIGQNWNKIVMDERDAEYLVATMQYEKAADAYKKILREVPQSASIKSRIGYCYLQTDDKQLEALPFLKEAAEHVSAKYSETSIKETDAPPETYFLLARAYQIGGQFNDAIDAYNKYKDMLKADDPMHKLVDNCILGCKNAPSFEQNPEMVKDVNLGGKVNNEFSNFNAVLSGNGKTLAYTTQTRNGFDVYVAKYIGDSLSTPQKITRQLGGDFLKTSSLSYGGTDLYLTSVDPENSDIYVSSLSGKKWEQAVKLPKPVNSKWNETHVAISKDGRTLYFTSNRKGGIGGLDIYKTTLGDKGKWTEPVNLGPEINTPFNEDTPFLSPDEKYLFFSSEGHDGMGGYDVFFVNLEGTPSVVNLGYPANTPGDDRFFFPLSDGKSGYVASARPGGLGKNDLYKITISRMFTLAGKVLAAAPGEVEGQTSVFIIDASTHDTIARPVVDGATGSFTNSLGAGNYVVSVENSHFEPSTQQVDIPENFAKRNVDITATLTPLPQQVAATTVPAVADTGSNKPTTPPEAKSEPALVEMPKPEAEEKPVTLAEKPNVRTAKIEPPASAEVTTADRPAGMQITYSIQLMALKRLIGVEYFKGVEGVEITTSPDGFYRYSVGTTTSLAQANETLKQLQSQGYDRAFVRVDRFEAAYTVQLMALKIPVETSYFNNLESVEVNKGLDGFYRYTYGSYSTFQQAAMALKELNEKGYRQAYIRFVKQ